MSKSIKLIAIDMDGTLLRSDKTVDPLTAADIRTAVENGIQVAYCTGRGTAEMQDTFRDLPMIRYAILTSGAVVYDRAEDLFIYQNGVNHPYIEQILETAARYDAMPHFLTDRESIVAEADISRMADFHMEIYQPMFRQIARKVSDMAAEGMRHDAIAKINIYFRSAEDRNEGYEALKHLPLQVTLSENTTLEMTAPETNKGTGLNRLAEYLHIPMSQTAAIGDNYNDIDMLKAAGFSVAMANAAPSIRELCDALTADNDFFLTDNVKDPGYICKKYRGVSEKHILDKHFPLSNFPNFQ